MSKSFDKETISELQKIRRANNAVLGCSQILSEHDTLKECTPGRLGAYLQLTAQQACGLLYAIEACSRAITDTFNGYLEERGVGWEDEHLPEVRREAEANAAMQTGEISFPEYEKIVDKPHCSNGGAS